MMWIYMIAMRKSAEGQLSSRSMKFCQFEGSYGTCLLNSNQVTATLEVQNNATK